MVGDAGFPWRVSCCRNNPSKKGQEVCHVALALLTECRIW
jgi:hypothetical protein